MGLGTSEQEWGSFLKDDKAHQRKTRHYHPVGFEAVQVQKDRIATDQWWMYAPSSHFLFSQLMSFLALGCWTSSIGVLLTELPPILHHVKSLGARVATMLGHGH